MKTYLEMLDHVLTHGTRRSDRTGVGTIGVFGYQNRYDLARGFPLLTTKKIHTRSVVAELLWFLRGDTNTAFLHEHGVRIWDDWQSPDGELGPVYGRQWRAWERPDGLAVDQIATVVRDLRLNPYSRRHLVSAWNPADVPRQALPACHALFQFYVTPPDESVPGSRGKLSCELYQRSADIFLGVPFNVASYALLTHILAESAGLDVGELVHTFGDLHLYANHVEAARTQLAREPRELPALRIAPRAAGIDATAVDDGSLDLYYRLRLLDGQLVARPRDPVVPEVDVLPAYGVTDFSFEGYDPHPAIKAQVAV